MISFRPDDRTQVSILKFGMRVKGLGMKKYFRAFTQWREIFLETCPFKFRKILQAAKLCYCVIDIRFELHFEIKRDFRKLLL